MAWREKQAQKEKKWDQCLADSELGDQMNLFSMQEGHHKEEGVSSPGTGVPLHFWISSATKQAFKSFSTTESCQEQLLTSCPPFWSTVNFPRLVSDQSLAEESTRRIRAVETC